VSRYYPKLVSSTGISELAQFFRELSLKTRINGARILQYRLSRRLNDISAEEANMIDPDALK